MKKIFISGSIELRQLHETVIASLNKLIEKRYQILIGDANGIDELVQNYLSKKNYHNVVVYSIFSMPRCISTQKFNTKTIAHDTSLKSEREKQIFKDIEMTKDCDICFVIWDGKSNGSYNNILRAIEYKKDIQVFLDNNFLSKEDITKNNITNIFNDRHEYSLTKYLDVVLKKHNQNIIKNTKQMKEILKEKGILSGENTYNAKYENMITIKINRGREVMKFKKELLDSCFLIDTSKKIEQTSLLE